MTHYVAEASLNGPVTDFFRNVFTGGARAAQRALDEQTTSAAVQRLLETSTGKDILTVVRGEAKEGVAEQIQENLPWLAGLIVGGGAIGGYALRGTPGAMVGGAIIAASMWKLMQSGQ